VRWGHSNPWRKGGRSFNSSPEAHTRPVPREKGKEVSIREEKKEGIDFSYPQKRRKSL